MTRSHLLKIVSLLSFIASSSIIVTSCHDDDNNASSTITSARSLQVGDQFVLPDLEFGDGVFEVISDSQISITGGDYSFALDERTLSYTQEKVGDSLVVTLISDLLTGQDAVDRINLELTLPASDLSVALNDLRNVAPNMNGNIFDPIERFEDACRILGVGLEWGAGSSETLADVDRPTIFMSVEWTVLPSGEVQAIVTSETIIVPITGNVLLGEPVVEFETEFELNYSIEQP